MEKVLIVLRNFEQLNQILQKYIVHLQTNQASTFMGCVLITKSQPKKSQINLPNKFDGIHSKFQGFVNQACLVIQLHPHGYPTCLVQVGLIGTLLSNMALVWFALLLKHQSPLLNEFETFLK